MTFDPKTHLIQLPRRVKDPNTGQFITRQDEYLEVRYRVQWFREKFPHGQIETKFFCLDWEKGIAICHATVSEGEGGQSTATGTETRKGFEDFVEKSETRSVGRALALLGFETQFVGEELSEGEHIADAPVTSTVAAPTETNSHTPAPWPDESLAHPTEGHLAALRNLAVTECQEPVDVYEDRLRATMKIPKQASVSPRLLSRSMPMATYMELFAYYRRLEAQLAKGKETRGGTTPTTQPATEPTPAATGESAAVPSPGSSSAPDPDPADADERDRVRLRAEVASWDLRVKPEEIELMIQRHPYSKARALLWKARTKAAAVTPIEAAAG
jgi:hypothetical protein